MDAEEAGAIQSQLMPSLNGTHGDSPSFLPDGGEMGHLVRTLDWAKTAIGSLERWSQTLRTVLSFMLANRFPLLLWWGPHYISIYNDAYRPIPGAKHPQAL